MQARILEKENVGIIRLLELGYSVCFVALLVDASFAAIVRNKSEVREALIFAVLAVVSFIVFSPAILNAPTH